MITEVTVRVLTGMSPLVDLEVLGPGEHFAAAGEGTRKRFFSRMNTNVIHKFVLCLEGPTVAGAALPEAGVGGALRSSDMLHGEVRHDLVHRGERLATRLPGQRLLGFDPHAGHLLLHGLPHVPEEGPVVRGVVRRVVRCHAGDGVVVSRRGVHCRELVVRGRLVVVRMMLRCRPRVHIHA